MQELLIVAGVVVAILIVIILMGYVKAPPDTAYMISGFRKPRILATRIVWPSLKRWVAKPVPKTAGNPNSRATIAASLSSEPVSATTALASLKSGVHSGSVSSHTSTSPFCIL